MSQSLAQSLFPDLFVLNDVAMAPTFQRCTHLVLSIGVKRMLQLDSGLCVTPQHLLEQPYCIVARRGNTDHSGTSQHASVYSKGLILDMSFFSVRGHPSPSYCMCMCFQEKTELLHRPLTHFHFLKPQCKLPFRRSQVSIKGSWVLFRTLLLTVKLLNKCWTHIPTFVTLLHIAH